MARRLRGKCPGCCTNGGAIFEKDYVTHPKTGELVWAYACCNCGYVKAPRVKSDRAPNTEPTAAQKKMVERVRTQIVNRHSHGHRDEYEFKKFEERFDAETGLLFLTTEYGRVGDEGTAAEFLCRDYRHFCIGSKGGIELMNPKGPKRKDGTRRTVRRRPKGLFNAVNELAGW